MNFKPYLPDNAKDGPVTIGSDICWRLNFNTDTPRHVTPAVVVAVAWALTNFEMPKQQESDLLNELELEWFLTPMGGHRLQPKARL